MKKILAIVLALTAMNALFAQQEPQFTMFMFNKLAYNPAYAGSTEAPCMTATYRNQWLGLEGAPQVQMISFQLPLMHQRIGVGGNIMRNTIGISEFYTADAAYAYRLKLGRGFLGIGMQASVRFLQNDYRKATAIQAGDDAIPGSMQSKYVPNFGAGLYYHTEKFYVGASAPRLLQNNIDLGDEERILSREVQHFYVMGGLVIKLADQFKLSPQVLLKYVDGAPFDADASLGFIFYDRFTVGAAYRLGGSTVSGAGESLDFILAAQLTNQLMIAASYDYTLSDLRTQNTGSVEVALRFCLGGKKQEGEEEYVNPRFF